MCGAFKRSCVEIGAVIRLLSLRLHVWAAAGSMRLDPPPLFKV
jgi:hypothetical protein